MAIHKTGTNTNDNTFNDELNREAKDNRSTERDYKQDARQEYAQAKSTDGDYVNGGFDQNSFQQAFKTNEGNSAEAMISAVADTFFMPISTGTLNSRATRTIELFKDYYKQAQEATSNTMQVDFIPAPGNKISHFYGGFAVAIPVSTADGKPQVAAHLVIVESNIKMQPRVETINNQQFSFVNTAGNTVTDDTIAGLQKLIMAHYKNDDLTYVDGGFTVIPSEVDIEDLTMLHRLVEVTASAAYARLQMYNINSVEDEGVALAQVAQAQSVRWAAQIEEKPQNQTNLTGQLIRTDFSIKTAMIPNQTQNQQYQLGALEFGEVNAFCSPVYAEPQQVMMSNGVWAPMSSQHYYNRIVVKDFRTGPTVRASIGSTLMLLATTSSLATNGVWKRAYIPNRHIDATQTDIHDIGALGYEVPMLNPDNYTPQQAQQAPKKEMIKTKVAEFTTEKFNMIMDAAFYQDLLYCIDVPDGHYMLGIFVAEANNNTVARGIIGKILNTMTGGRFYEMFGPDDQMFYTDGERVLEGYYPNTTTGMSRPLDDVDHLALLNITNGDAEWIKQWEQFDNGQTLQEIRLARRTEIIQTFADDRAVVKSYSTRLTIEPKFMEALTKSLHAAGLFPTLTGNMGANATYTRASANQYAGLVINPSHIPNVFAGNNNNSFNNYRGFGTNTYTGNWG